MIYSNGKYYVFGTGAGILEWSSTDMKTWNKYPNVFSETPSWVFNQIQNFSGDIWAPDISFYNGQYYLLYSVSQYGTNNSAIGIATNVTLDKSDSLYKWIDHGKIISSAGSTWNAIDPNLVLDTAGNPYIAFGSFFDGIKIVPYNTGELQANNLGLAVPTIASRSAAVIQSSVNAIEAPFIFKRGNYYYLFASIGSCCQGVSSTYQTIVGRSQSVNGIYYDDSGSSLAQGGGKVILQGNKNWHGAGGGSVCNINNTDYFVFFSYDAQAIPRLRIAKINWDASGWPSIQQLD